MPKWVASALALVFMAGMLAACRQAPAPTTAVAYVVIEPAAALFTHVGDARSFSATAFDAQGRPLDVEIDWQVADPSVLHLDAIGIATALVPLGSTQLVATAGGVASAPALAMLAAPVAGAVLVDDAQIVGGLEPVDPVDDFDIGWRYRAILSGLPLPAVGTVLIGTGEAPLAGRVVSAAPAGDHVEVILELVALDALFDAFAIDETIDLRGARIAWDEDLLTDFDMVPQADGSFDLVPRASALQIEPQQSGLSYALGPLTCKAEATAAPLQLNGVANVKITPGLTFQVERDRDGQLKLWALSGSLGASLKLEPKIEAAFEGKVECTVQLGALYIPLGALGLFVGGQVPLGLGFELNGDVTGATVGLAIEAAANVQATVGFECASGSCQTLALLEITRTGGVAPKIEGPSETLKVDVRVHAFGYAKLAIGNPFFKRLGVDAFELRGGPALLFDLAMPQVQADNASYRSDVRAVILGVAKASSKFDVFLKLLKVSAAKFEVKREIVLAQMPTGTLKITPSRVAAGSDAARGQMATFTVELEGTDFLGTNAVERIEILWRRDGTNLEAGRAPCTRGPVGQSTFTCSADFLEEHQGTQTFYAFVHVKLFGVTLAIPLEIHKDARATVTVYCGGLEGGYNHTAFLLCDGALYAWGYNNGGGLPLFRSSPTLVPKFGAVGTSITSIAAGSGHLAALLSDGALYAWGVNFYGQLGDGTITDRGTPTRVPDFPPEGTSIISIAAGQFFSAALLSDGSLYTWGHNNVGQLGDGTFERRTTPTVVPNFPPLGASITTISAGDAHTAVLLDDGTLYTWGQNATGQLGIGTPPRTATPPRPYLPSGLRIPPSPTSLPAATTPSHSSAMARSTSGVSTARESRRTVSGPPPPSSPTSLRKAPPSRRSPPADGTPPPFSATVGSTPGATT
jgi:hypothetical protein